MHRPSVLPSAAFVAIIGLLVTSPLPPAEAQLEDLVARVKPAVVVVRVQHVLGGGGHGTGFIYDRSGYILTNQHVVEGAKTITVILPDKRAFPATVVDYVRHQEMACPPTVESWIDAAVLKIEAADLPTVPLGDSGAVRQGQEILVMGYPGGVSTEEVSVTRGIIGAVRNGWFQTDASMMPGNSGGPALDREGASSAWPRSAPAFRCVSGASSRCRLPARSRRALWCPTGRDCANSRCPASATSQSPWSD